MLDSGQWRDIYGRLNLCFSIPDIANEWIHCEFRSTSKQNIVCFCYNFLFSSLRRNWQLSWKYYNCLACFADPVTKILQECISSSFQGNMRDINTTLELYRASEFILYPDERGLEEQNLRLKLLHEQELSSGFTRSCQLGRSINAKVDTCSQTTWLDFIRPGCMR